MGTLHVRHLALAGALLVGSASCEAPTGPERELSGEQLYIQYCARCHGEAGKPPPEQPGARDLSNALIVDALDDERIKRAIIMGKPPIMPGFGDRFTDAALEVIVAHVRSLSGSKGPRAREQ